MQPGLLLLAKPRLLQAIPYLLYKKSCPGRQLLFYSFDGFRSAKPCAGRLAASGQPRQENIFSSSSYFSCVISAS